MTTHRDIKQVMKALRELSSPARAQGAAKYLQIRVGGYGEGDKMLGVSNPHIHQVVKRFRSQINGECERVID